MNGGGGEEKTEKGEGREKKEERGKRRAEWVEGPSPAPPTRSTDGKPDTAGHCVLLKNNQTALLK